eukprot:TRINITY_DN36942_c0_g1_i1.p1 TRINITY_DN36942_c0_g1~~TRINITY_DN36942_c0_g1_i1.p1  ORF type:complete len:468 (+),score=108.21 TRINITY_DN36942_c0_g1_i1:43-1446(+)
MTLFCNSISRLPWDVAADVFGFLDPADLSMVELVNKTVQGVISRRRLWRVAYEGECREKNWRMPCKLPPCWKRYYHLSRKERNMVIQPRIEGSSVTIRWRISLPEDGKGFRRRSAEFKFSNDALGQPIRWQIEVELDDHNKGMVRMWTTNNWTTDATRHYYGSHCTISLRDPVNGSNVHDEVPVDIDNSAALTFNSNIISPAREMVVRVNLTLALELAVPLDPFYELISGRNTHDSDNVKVGYCKAVFEVARCRRKNGGIFVRKEDRHIHELVILAGNEETSADLRVEVFQALFNLLGPTSILLDKTVVLDLLQTCFRCLNKVPVPCPVYPVEEMTTACLLAQNTLGTIFNLLVHPLTRESITPDALRGVTLLLNDPTYRICHFSVITVLLTVLTWGKLPICMYHFLISTTNEFMSANNPLDSDCTGVAWDESDIAAFFIPLLRSRHLVAVKFATWCVAKYYFPAEL